MNKTFKQILWFLVPFIVCIIALATIYFIAVDHQSLFNKNILQRILINAYMLVLLILPTGIILGLTFKTLILKLPKLIQKVIIVFVSGIFIWFLYLTYSFKFSYNNTIYIFSKFELNPKYFLFFNITLIFILGIFLSMGFLVCFYISKMLRNFYAKNAIQYGSIIILGFTSFQINSAYVSLGWPRENSVANYMVYQFFRNSPLITAVILILAVAFLIIMCFIYWSIEKAIMNLREKRF